MSKKIKGRPAAIGLKSIRTSEIGNIIRTYRTLNKVGLKELADKLGVSLQFISNIEHARASVPLKYIDKLASIVRVPADKLAVAAMTSRPCMAEYADQVKTFKSQ